MSEPYSAAGGLVRVYPGRTPTGAGLVWAHGGGFAGGALDMPEADSVAHALTARGITVVSIDYRLAGDGCRYPAPSDDVLAAWSWAVDNSARLRIDPARLAIGGASAGANLVTGAVLRLLAGKVPVPSAGEGPVSSAGEGPVPSAGEGPMLPAAVVLAYPTLHAAQPPTPPALRAALDAQPDADRFGPAAVREMYENFVGHPLPRGDEAPLPAVPGLASASDLAGFPPTLMINGDVDELRVSGEAFAATLAEAGVDVEVLTEAGTQHGHLNRPHEPGFEQSLDRIAARIARLASSIHAPTSTPASASMAGARLTEGSFS